MSNQQLLQNAIDFVYGQLSLLHETVSQDNETTSLQNFSFELEKLDHHSPTFASEKQQLLFYRDTYRLIRCIQESTNFHNGPYALSDNQKTLFLILKNQLESFKKENIELYETMMMSNKISEIISSVASYINQTLLTKSVNKVNLLMSLTDPLQCATNEGHIETEAFPKEFSELVEASPNYSLEKKQLILYRGTYQYLIYNFGGNSSQLKSAPVEFESITNKPVMRLTMLVNMLKKIQEEHPSGMANMESSKHTKNMMEFLHHELFQRKNEEMISEAVDCLNFIIATKCEKAKVGSQVIQEIIEFPVKASNLHKGSKHYNVEEKQIALYEEIYKLLTSGSKKTQRPNKEKGLSPQEKSQCFELILYALTDIALNSPAVFSSMIKNSDSNNILIYLYVLDISHHEEMLFKRNTRVLDSFLHQQSNRTKVILDYLSNYYIKQALPSPLVFAHQPGNFLSTMMQMQTMQSAQLSIEKMRNNPLSQWSKQLIKVNQPYISESEKKNIIITALDEFKDIKETVDATETIKISLFEHDAFSIMDSFLQLVLGSSLIAKIESQITNPEERALLSIKCLKTFNIPIPEMLLAPAQNQLSCNATLLLMAKYQTNAFDLYESKNTAYQQMCNDLSQRYFTQFADPEKSSEYTSNDIFGLCHSIEVLLLKIELARKAGQTWPLPFITEKAFWRTCGYSLRLAPFHSQNMIMMYSQFVNPVVMGLMKYNLYGEAKAYSDFVGSFHEQWTTHFSYDYRAYSSLGFMLSAFDSAGCIDDFKEYTSKNLISPSSSVKQELLLQDTYIKLVLNALFQAFEKDLHDNDLSKTNLIIAHLISVFDCGKKTDRNIYNQNLYETKKITEAFQHLTNTLLAIQPSNQSGQFILPKLTLPQINMKSLTELLNGNIYSYVSPLRNAMVNYLVNYAESSLSPKNKVSFEQHSYVVNVLNWVKPILSLLQVDEDQNQALRSAFQVLELELKSEQMQQSLLDELDESKTSTTRKKSKKKKKKKSSTQKIDEISESITQQPHNGQKDEAEEEEEDVDLSILLARTQQKFGQTISAKENSFKIESTSKTVAKQPNDIKKIDEQSSIQVSPVKQTSVVQQQSPSKKTSSEKPPAPLKPKQNALKKEKAASKQPTPQVPVRTGTTELKATSKQPVPQTSDSDCAVTANTKINSEEANSSLQPWITISKKSNSPKKEKTTHPKKNKAKSEKQSCSAQSEMPVKAKSNQQLLSTSTNPSTQSDESTIDGSRSRNDRASEKPTSVSIKIDQDNFPELSSASEQKKSSTPAIKSSKNNRKKVKADQLDKDTKLDNTDQSLELEKARTQQDEPSPDSHVFDEASQLIPSTFEDYDTEIPGEIKQTIFAYADINGLDDNHPLRQEFEIIKLINNGIKDYCELNNKPFFPLIITGKTVSHIHRNKVPNDWDCLSHSCSLRDIQIIIENLSKQYHWGTNTCSVRGNEFPIAYCNIPLNGKKVQLDIAALQSQQDQPKSIKQLLHEDAAKRDILSTTYHLLITQNSTKKGYPILNTLNLLTYQLPTGETKSYLDCDCIEINSSLNESIIKNSDGNEDIFSQDPIRFLRVLKEMMDEPHAGIGQYLHQRLHSGKNWYAFWFNCLKKQENEKESKAPQLSGNAAKLSDHGLFSPRKKSQTYGSSQKKTIVLTKIQSQVSTKLERMFNRYSDPIKKQRLCQLLQHYGVLDSLIHSSLFITDKKISENQTGYKRSMESFTWVTQNLYDQIYNGSLLSSHIPYLNLLSYIDYLDQIAVQVRENSMPQAQEYASLK